MAEGDSIEQKSEASTIEVTHENGPRNNNSTKNKVNKKPMTTGGKVANCKVLLLDGTEYECQVDVSDSCVRSETQKLIFNYFFSARPRLEIFLIKFANILTS